MDSRWLLASSLFVTACFTDRAQFGAGSGTGGDATAGGTGNEAGSGGSAGAEGSEATVDTTGVESVGTRGAGSDESGMETSTSDSGMDSSTDGGTAADTGGDTSVPVEPVPLPANAILMFDSACPARWFEVVEFQGAYLRVADLGATPTSGGSPTHLHTLEGHTHVLGQAGGPHSHTIEWLPDWDTGYDAHSSGSGVSQTGHQHPGTVTDPAGSVHTHTLPASAPTLTVAMPNEPAFREVVLCRNDDFQPHLEVPVGAMGLFDSACGDGWEEDAGFRERLIRGHDGDETYAEMGGQDRHEHALTHDHGATDQADAHAHTGTTTTQSGTALHRAGMDSTHALAPHTHDFVLAESTHAHTLPAEAPSSAAADAVPPFRETVVCRKVEETAMPPSTLRVMAVDTCPDEWSEDPEYAGNFLRGHDASGTTGELGGALTHSHDATHDHGGLTEPGAHTHTLESMTPPDNTGLANAVISGAYEQARHDHTHAIDSITTTDTHRHVVGSAPLSLDSVDHTPVFRELRVCRSGG